MKKLFTAFITICLISNSFAYDISNYNANLYSVKTKTSKIANDNNTLLLTAKTNVNSNQTNKIENNNIIGSLLNNALNNLLNKDDAKEDSNADKSEVNNETELNKKLKELADKKVIKEILNNEPVKDVLKKKISGLTQAEKNYAKDNYKGLSFDLSNFDTDEKAFSWLEDAFKIIIKDSVNKEILMQETIDEYKILLKIIGIKVDDIKIEKGMSDEDIETLCIAIIDTMNKIANKTMLKLVGLDLDNPDIMKEIRETIGIE